MYAVAFASRSHRSLFYLFCHCTYVSLFFSSGGGGGGLGGKFVFFGGGGGGVRGKIYLILLLEMCFLFM